MIENRNLSRLNNDNGNIFFVLASVFKSLYFFPFVILLKSKHKLDFWVIGSFLLLCFPLCEALLLGTRKALFEIFLIIFISSFLFKKIRVNVKNGSLFLAAIFVLMTISYKILLKREASRKNNKDVYTSITSARYNEVLKPNKNIIAYINDPSISPIKRNYALIFLHSGQYINHGLFEFNHIIDNPKLQMTCGKYNMDPFFKFLNKIGINESYKSVNPSPREYVYLTSFGSFYLDFGWFSILVFFTLGFIQRYIFTNSNLSIIHSPLVVYLIIINVFLPIFNYLRGAGIYPFVGFIFLLIIYHYFLKRTNEKSIDT